MAEQFEEMSFKGFDNIADYIRSPRLLAEKLLGKSAITSSLTIPMQQHDPVTGKTEVTLRTIPFYMQDDFSVGNLSNSWKDLVDTSQLNAFTDLLNAVSITSNTAQITPQSEAMSTKVWKGSTFGGFTVDCLFVATRRSLDPTKIIQALARTALPGKAIHGDPSVSAGLEAGRKAFSTVAGFAGGTARNIVTGADVLVKKFNEGKNDLFDLDEAKGQVDRFTQFSQALIEDMGMTAPLQYGITYDESTDEKGNLSVTGVRPRPYTTVMLQIGDYFRAPYLLVESISNITFSKEIIKPADNFGKLGTDVYDNSPEGDNYGFPLYGKCSISLQPCSMLHVKKFENYFIKPSTAGLNSVFDVSSAYENGENLPR